ncbi:MAG: oxidoreductase [Loktanella sp.]|nr:oxidoreductase [Loktanella sp.]
MKRNFLYAVSTVCTTLAFATVALAEDAILTVNSDADGRSVSFTYEELLALPQTEFRTGTIWTSDVDSYAGPTLAAVLDAAEVSHGDLRIYAINDYNVEFPADKISTDAPVLAVQVNGKPFSIREKGPIWLLFPFDDDDSYRTEDHFALSVWQLQQIDVSPE